MNARHSDARAAVRAAAVRYGAERRTNDWYLAHRPELVRAATDRALSKAFSTDRGDAKSAAFDAEMQRFVADPFRGAQVRYLLAHGETALGLEVSAARDAIAAAGLAPGEIDAVLCSSWLPENFVPPGDAVFIANSLGITVPAYNVESACSSGLACLDLADGLLASGRYRRILVVLSSTNSRQTGDDNTLGWISSDVAAALVVDRAGPREGVLAIEMENTAATCGAFEHVLVNGPEGRARVQMAVGQAGGKALRDATGPDLVRRLCLRALDKAGVNPGEVAFWGFSTPLAWYSSLCRSALDIPEERTHDLFPRTANVGAPFPAIHLHHAVAEGRVRSGDLVVLFTVGSVSSAGAAVVRLGELRAAAGRLP